MSSQPNKNYSTILYLYYTVDVYSSKIKLHREQNGNVLSRKFEIIKKGDIDEANCTKKVMQEQTETGANKKIKAEQLHKSPCMCLYIIVP